jgi:excisionase family DNA binding protein
MFSAETSNGQFVRVSQAARELGVSRATVLGWVRAGKLRPARQYEGLVLIPRQVIDEFIANATRPREAQAA